MAISQNNTIITSDITTALNGKSNEGHTHDGRYYTESEVDNLLAQKAPKFKYYNFDLDIVSPGEYVYYIKDSNLEAGTPICIRVNYAPNTSVSSDNPIKININYSGTFVCHYISVNESTKITGTAKHYSSVEGSGEKTIMEFTCTAGNSSSSFVYAYNTYEYTLLLLQ